MYIKSVSFFSRSNYYSTHLLIHTVAHYCLFGRKWQNFMHIHDKHTYDTRHTYTVGQMLFIKTYTNTDVAQLQQIIIFVWFSSVKSLFDYCWMLRLLSNYEFICMCLANEHTKSAAFHREICSKKLRTNTEIISFLFVQHRIENLRLRLACTREHLVSVEYVFS